MSLKAHMDAVRAVVLQFGVWPVHQSALLDGGNVPLRQNYSIVFAHKPRPRSERFTKVAVSGDRLDFDVGVKLVGTTADSVEKALERMDPLDGLVLEVPGRSCSPIETDSGPVLIDTSVKPGLFYVDVSLRFTSRPGGG